jgi:hypothetical protein
VSDLDFDALGAQYREAKASVTEHRLKQAQAETAYATRYQRLASSGQPLEGNAELDAARAAVEKAVADVEWCKAVTIAAAEEFKGESFETVVERNALRESPDVVEAAAAEEGLD